MSKFKLTSPSSTLMKKSKIWHLYATATILLVVLTGIILHSRSGAPNPSKQPQSSTPSPQQGPAASSTPLSLAPKPSKTGDPESVEELSAFIRKFSAQGGDANALYARIAGMRLPEKTWWRSATDFSSLLELSTDATVSEAGRTAALRLFVAGVPKSELEKQADSLQATFSDASDAMVSALLQDMADRKVAPRTLILLTLENPQRGENARCLAWYAARLTDSTNPTLVSHAIKESASGCTVNSKVAFDFLAAAPHSAQFETAPALRQTVDDLVAKAMKLPAAAGIMEMANADAFIIALPNLMEEARAKQTFLSLLNNAPNPEVRLSALEQIVKRQTTGTDDMSSELDSIRKNITSIFPDEAKQIRANALLKRIQ